MPTVPDYSIGWTQVELEELLSILKEELKRTIASYSESGTQVIAQKTEDIHIKMQAVIKALQKKDPDTYGSIDKKTSTSVVNQILSR